MLIAKGCITAATYKQLWLTPNILSLHSGLGNAAKIAASNKNIWTST